MMIHMGSVSYDAREKDFRFNVLGVVSCASKVNIRPHITQQMRRAENASRFVCEFTEFFLFSGSLSFCVWRYMVLGSTRARWYNLCIAFGRVTGV